MTKLRLYKIPAAVNFPFISEGIEEEKVKEPYDKLVDFSSISNVYPNYIQNKLINIFNVIITNSNKEMLDFLLNVKGMIPDKDESLLPNDVKISFILADIGSNLKDYEKIKISIKAEQKDKFAAGGPEENRPGYSVTLANTSPKEDSFHTILKRFQDEIDDIDGIPMSYEKLVRRYLNEERRSIFEMIERDFGDASEKEKLDKYREELNKGKVIDMDKDELYLKDIIAFYEGFFSITIDKTILGYYINIDTDWEKLYSVVLCHELAHVYTFMLNPFKARLSDDLEQLLRDRLRDCNAMSGRSKLDNELLKKYQSAMGIGAGHSRYNIHDKITKDEVDKLLNYLKTLK